jgi:selenide,water dikinase
MEIFNQAGVALVGGHSIKDEEIKLGFAITGVIDPAVAAALEKPTAGDALVLTKPLGTGVLTFARQIGKEFPEGLAAAAVSMATLNQAGAEAMREAGASACTDVTGFGLFAHLRRMLRPGGLGAEIFAGALPALPDTLDALRQEIIPGAIERNREYVGDALHCETGVDEALVNLGFDAQTSGGLLIAIPVPRLETLRRLLAQRGAEAFVIGRIINAGAGQILVKPGKMDISEFTSINKAQETDTMKTSSPSATPEHASCCADIFNAETARSSVPETQKAFGAFMQSVQTGGALSAKTKELILFSLVLHSRCQPCFETHFRKARELGITQVELDEAAWCAIALGGAPVKMFYTECLEKMLKAKG